MKKRGSVFKKMLLSYVLIFTIPFWGGLTFYYLFERDNKSNTDVEFIKDMISILVNERENEGYERQGVLLFSYPSIESFTESSFGVHCFDKSFILAIV